jgi:hypothetical protein
VIGAAGGDLGLPVAGHLAGAAAVFAGAANCAALTLLTAGAGAWTVLATVALVNARFVVYSASLEPRFRHQPRWFRWLGPALLIDQNYRPDPLNISIPGCPAMVRRVVDQWDHCAGVVPVFAGTVGRGRRR